MLLPDHIFSLIKAVHAANPGLSHGDDDARRGLQKKIVETVVARYPGQGWGWKRASDTRPPSKDAIANNRLLPNHLIAWDCFDGATRQPAQRESEIIDDQVFIELAGVDHLGSQPMVASAAPPAAPAASAAPARSAGPALPSRDEFFSALQWLDGVYRQQLGRPGGVDLEGIAAHIFDTYLHARMRGLSADEAKSRIVQQINGILGRTDIRV
jgi:hypothetical protein